MNSRYLLGSLVVIAMLSGVVVAEAERNYVAVTSVSQSTASVGSVSQTDDGLRIQVVVENSMNEPLRVQYVRLKLDRRNYTDATSFPYQGRRTLPPGESSMMMTVPTRQLSGDLSEDTTLVVEGFVAVEVYNGYRFEIPIEPTEVTL
ncbi:hypothetical protein [Halolamina sp.]|uniref:hypothetical protein n=1 Tax=Halolamina sp. TaxID=1940283 RepID=UPI003566ABD8